MPDDVAAEVAAGLAAWGMRPVGPIARCGGIEISSSNFKVPTDAGPLLCKRVPAAAHEVLGRKLRLVQWLAGRADGVPTPIPALDASLTVRDAAGVYAWCVWPFVAGEHFLGGESQVRAAGAATGRLHAALAAAPADLWPEQRWTYEFDDLPDLMDAAAHDVSRWTEVFGPAAAQCLEARIEDLPALASEMTRLVAALREDAWQPCHGDLHPHNILMRAEQVAAIVDMDSLVIAPYPVAAGFARYKLVRQAVSGGGDAAILGRVFTAALRSEDFRPGLDNAILRAGALAEIIRRLLLVLRLHYFQSDSRWNHVLAVHLAGLEEVEAISGLPGASLH